MKSFLVRKVMHGAVAFIVVCSMFFLPRFSHVLFVSFLTVLLLSLQKRNLLHGYGVAFTDRVAWVLPVILGVFCQLLWRDIPASVFMLGVAGFADPAAAIVGRLIQTHTYFCARQGKTWAGALTFFLVAIGAAAWGLVLASISDWSGILFLKVGIVAAILTMAEWYSPNGWDNVVLAPLSVIGWLLIA